MLSVKNVSKSFDENVISDLSFELAKGQYICLTGESGSGKTTVLNLIAGLIKPDNGDVFLDDTPVSDIPDLLQKYIAYMPCGNVLFDALTVQENIDLVNRSSALDLSDMFTDTGILSLLKKRPYELSSGEYKRVLFVRTLSMNTPYILLDEPTSNLDKNSAEKIINLIDKLSNDKGLIIATHDSRLMKGIKICIEN